MCHIWNAQAILAFSNERVHKIKEHSQLMHIWLFVFFSSTNATAYFCVFFRLRTFLKNFLFVLFVFLCKQQTVVDNSRWMNRFFVCRAREYLKFNCLQSRKRCNFNAKLFVPSLFEVAQKWKFMALTKKEENNNATQTNKYQKHM